MMMLAISRQEQSGFRPLPTPLEYPKCMGLHLKRLILGWRSRLGGKILALPLDYPLAKVLF
ncbi:hypothetical protein OROMI_002560 [Orobanche minor]